ncbi:hypothetical protein D3C77_814340 [compost metagenome]
MHFTHLVAEAGVEQDPLGGGGLTGIHVGADADIAIAVDWCSTGHGRVLAR